MSATASMVARLRLMVNEPDSTTYSDLALAERIETYPLPDSVGLAPTATDWAPTYDLNLAAAGIWTEKAATLVTQYSFSADGASFQRGQAYDNAIKMAAHYTQQSQLDRKRTQGNRKGKSITLKATPPPVNSPGYYPNQWIGNEPEPHDDDIQGPQDWTVG